MKASFSVSTLRYSCSFKFYNAGKSSGPHLVIFHMPCILNPKSWDSTNHAQFLPSLGVERYSTFKQLSTDKNVSTTIYTRNGNLSTYNVWRENVH